MGIPGLTTFVDDNPHLLSDLKLQDSKILIDGNNLFHFLYYYFKVSHEYGGDYNLFAGCVRFFFRTMAECGIAPYVVFDGAYDQDDRKLATSMRRAKERIHLAGFLSHMGYAKILPILAHETFLAMLEEARVPHATFDYEADAEIAALAQLWRCPVMTNDSDFFIYDLPGGVILFDYINLETHMRGDGSHTTLTDGADHSDSTGSSSVLKYIKVQLYRFNVFCAQFTRADRKLIPLFASIMGNDLIDKRRMAPFFASLRLPKVTTRKIVASKKHLKKVSVLHWLANCETYDNALEKVVGCFPTDTSDAMRALLVKSVDIYASLEPNLDRYLTADRSKMGEETYHSKLRTYGGRKLPDWLVATVRRGQLSPFVINAMVTRRAILLSQVEVMSAPSAYSCALPIRQYIYGLLVAYDNDGTGDVTSSDWESPVGKARAERKSKVEELDREERAQRRQWIEPRMQLSDGSPLPSLEAMSSCPRSQRLHVFCSALGLDKSSVEKQLPANFQLTFAVILYWIQNAEPKVHDLELYALLVSVVKLGAVDVVQKQMANVASAEAKEVRDCGDVAVGDGTETDESGPSASLVEPSFDGEATLSEWLADRASQPMMNDVFAQLKKFTFFPKHKYTTDFEPSIIHAYSQFQACFVAASALNRLLRSPVTSCSPALILNGTFLYNLCKDMRTKKTPTEDYIQGLLGGPDSPVWRLFQLLRTRVLESLPGESSLLEYRAPERQRPKKKGKKGSNKGRKTSSKDHEGTSEEDAEESEGSGKNRLKVKCKLSNKFAQLSVED